MKARAILAALAAALLCAGPADADGGSVEEGIVMVGPMIHYNFGGSSGSGWSFAVEASYWKGLLGWDAGVEFDMRKRVRMYAEAEAGLLLAGLAMGPMIQFGNGGFDAGVQASAWANYFAGADFRFRAPFRGPLEKAPGFYLKLPADAYDGRSDGDRSGFEWD